MTDTQLFEGFDSELYVPPISSLSALEHVLKEVDLFPRDEDRERIIRKLESVGYSWDENTPSRLKLNIGVKKLLSVIEMARQEPEAVGDRLLSGLMGLGMVTSGI
jgi:vesicle-fusing ATPase